MSLLLNSALAQQLTAGTYGSPRTTKGPLIPLPVVQHGSKVGSLLVFSWCLPLHAGVPILIVVCVALSTQACVQQQPARHLPAPPSATGKGAAAHQSLPSNGTAAALNGNGNGSLPAAPAVSSEFQKIQAAVTYIRSRCSLKPEVVLVLGSGLGPIADEVQDATVIPYAEVPHFHAPAVQGHPGRLVLGMFNGVPALVLQVCAGRRRGGVGWGGGGYATEGKAAMGTEAAIYMQRHPQS
jgi:hypothetical protein